MKTPTGAFTVSGGGIDRNGYESGMIALSGAINMIQRLPGEATLYVRDRDGTCFGRVEQDADGIVLIYRLTPTRRSPK